MSGTMRVGQGRDLVLQRQLALLQPRDLELVDRSGDTQQLDLLVESAMLGLEQDQDLSRDRRRSCDRS